MKLSTEEQIEIQDLYARYNMSTDIGAPEQWAACFTPDGVMTMLGPSPGAKRVNKGTEDLVTFKRQEQAGRKGRYRRHWNGNILLQKLDSNDVRGRCYLRAYEGDPGTLPVLTHSGVYEDVIVRFGDEWRFATRTLTLD